MSECVRKGWCGVYRDDLETVVMDQYTDSKAQNSSAGLIKIQERETQTYTGGQAHNFPFQRDKSPRHPKDRHQSPPLQRIQLSRKDRHPFSTLVPCTWGEQGGRQAQLPLLSQAVPA